MPRASEAALPQAPTTGEPFGKYRLLRKLAQGGMAAVYLAEGANPRKDPLVCVKLMLPGYADDAEFLQMFVQEAKLTVSLHHPNLVQVDDLGLQGGRLYLAMEYIRGHAVSVLLKKLSQSGRVIEPELAAGIISQAARGLGYAHDAKDLSGKPMGLVHRDVSPHNMILRFDGLLKVVDFGIAKATAVAGTRTQNLKGKLPYMSPEQLNGKGIDRRTDIFALGASLFELCTGKRMFSGETDPALMKQILFEPIPDPRTVNPDVPDGLAEIVQKACARSADKRYRTAEQLAEALERFTAERDPDVQGSLATLARDLLEPLPETREQAMTGLEQELVPVGNLSFVDDGDTRPGPAKSQETRASSSRSERRSKPAGTLVRSQDAEQLEEELLEALEEDEDDDQTPPPAPAPRRSSPRPQRVVAAEEPAPAPSKMRWLLPVLAVGGLGVGAGALFATRSPEAAPPPAAMMPAAMPSAAPREKPAEAAPVGEGTLTVFAVPWAKVTCEGKDLGITPVHGAKVSAGHVTLVLDEAGEGRQRYVLPVDVKAGQETVVGSREEPIVLKTLKPAPAN